MALLELVRTDISKVGMLTAGQKSSNPVRVRAKDRFKVSVLGLTIKVPHRGHSALSPGCGRGVSKSKSQAWQALKSIPRSLLCGVYETDDGCIE